MPTARVLFGPLLEDQPGFLTPGILRALNLYPRQRSYGPFRALEAQSNALDGRCLGAASARDADDNVYIYAGDATKLYESVGFTFSDESKSGGYSTADGDLWEFVHWSYANQIVATNFTDPVQALSVGDGASSAFADLIGSTLTPKAKHVGQVWPAFLVLGNTEDATDGHMPNRVWWSAYRDATDFDPDAATQCDYEDLAFGGTVQKIVGMTQYGLCFQTNAIRAMQYVGPGVVFDVTPIETGHGTPIPSSVIARGRNCFYINEEGFFAVRDGAVHPLGDGLVDRAFWDEFDIANKAAVSAAIDPVNRVAAWAYPGEGSTGGLPNRIRMCRWEERRWSEAEVDTTVLFSSETQGYTLDGLDALSTDIDSGDLESFDSDAYKGGLYRMAAFDHSHKLGTFTGTNLGATIETGDIQLADGRRARVVNTRPLVDGSAEPSVAASGRARLTDAVSYGSASAMNAEGECPLLVEGRYHRFRQSLTASVSWSHVQGLEVMYRPAGRY